MKITTVSLSRTIPTGPYMNDKVGMEATLEEGESESDALHTLSARIEKWHKENSPHLYQESNPITSGYVSVALPIQVPEIYYTEQIPSTDVLSLIQTAADLETLKSFKVIAGSPGNEELYKAYNSRVKELMK